MPSSRQIVPRPIGGFDRSRESHASRQGALYDVLNLRPSRGELIQPKLVGPFVDDVGSAIVIVDDDFGWETFDFEFVPGGGEAEDDSWETFFS